MKTLPPGVAMALSLVGLAALSPATLTAQTSPERIAVPPYEAVALPFGLGAYAGPCPSAWPARVLSLLDSTGITPRLESCSSVVDDFNGDGLTDVVMTAFTPDGPRFVVVFDRDRPSLQHVADAGPFDGLVSIPSGDHRLSGCFDIIDPLPAPQKLADRVSEYSDGRLRFPHAGFAISFDGKGMRYYHYEGDVLHQEEGSGC